MTYYKNQAEVKDKLSEIVHNHPAMAIEDIIETIFSKVHGFLLITNITSRNKSKFYSLKIDPEQIHLVEKEDHMLSTFCYDISSHNIFLNNQQMGQETMFQLCQKITQILADLEHKKAFAYEQSL